MLNQSSQTHPSQKSAWLLFLAIVLVAAGLRLWRINTLPPGLYFDEAYEGLEAWRIYSDPTYRPVFLKGDFGVVPLNAYANAVMFALFRFFGGEAGPVAMHVTAACFGVLGVITLYGVARELQKLDRRKPSLSSAFPFFAAAVLAVMRWHLHFSRMGTEQIIVPFTWAGSMWFLLAGWRTGHWLYFAGCGVMVAASVYAYEAAWVIPFLMVVVVGLLVLSLLLRNDRGVVLLHLWRTIPEPHPFSITPLSLQRRWGVLLAGMIAFLLFAPLGWFFWQHPDQVLFRFKQVTVVDSLAQHAAPDSALKNSWATVKMYGIFDGLGDHTSRRNLGGEPALNLWLALAFYIGIVLTVWRLRRVSYVLVLLSLVGLLLPGAPTEHAPQFGRLIGGTAPTALLCAVGLDWLWQWRPNRATYLRSSSILLIVLGGVTTTYDYFGRWAALPSLYGAFDVGVWQLTQQLRRLPPELPVYLAIQNPQVHAVQFA